MPSAKKETAAVKKVKAAVQPPKKPRTKATALPYEWQRINYYFELLDEEGPAEDLWKMLKLALIADNDRSTERDRSNMLFFYENTKELFENIYSLLQQIKKAYSKKSKENKLKT